MPFITISTAATRLGVSPQYARRLLRGRPDLGRMIGGRWRVLDGDALAQICENRKAKQRK